MAISSITPRRISRHRTSGRSRTKGSSYRHAPKKRGRDQRYGPEGSRVVPPAQSRARTRIIRMASRTTLISVPQDAEEMAKLAVEGIRENKLGSSEIFERNENYFYRLFNCVDLWPAAGQARPISEQLADTAMSRSGSIRKTAKAFQMLELRSRRCSKRHERSVVLDRDRRYFDYLRKASTHLLMRRHDQDILSSTSTTSTLSGWERP